MPAPWTTEEKKQHFDTLQQLYVVENKTIGEIGKILNYSEQTIYDRLLRVGIKPTPETKPNYLLKPRDDIKIPKTKTPELAEFFGIMLGDGHISYYQTWVHLGTKELEYLEYIVSLMEKLFGVKPKTSTKKDIRSNGHYRSIYLGSVQLRKWLQNEGLVHNKVRSQVDAPRWILNNKIYMQRFLRGFFDTDGSVYKLRWGIQVEFTNKSKPLLKSIKDMLSLLGYRTSKIVGPKLYLTYRPDVVRFFKEVGSKNSKHYRRFSAIMEKLGG